jgi:hypothetical protein
MDLYGINDLHKSEMLNMVVHKGIYFPNAPEVAQIFYNTNDSTMYIYTPTGWTPLAFGDSTSVPSGLILAFNNPISEIPTGWVLCNGTAGTPDLVNRFVKSIPTNTTAPMTYGGFSTHTHGIANHYHTLAMTIGGGGNSVNPEPGGTPSPAAGHTHNVSAASASGVY